MMADRYSLDNTHWPLIIYDEHAPNPDDDASIVASFPLPHGAEPDDPEGEAVQQAADALKQALNAMQECGGRLGR
jgi:hypothetical protein